MENKAPKTHPILFSTPMVQAILEGRKTQTRRVVKLPNYHPSMLEKQKNKLTIKDWKLYDGNQEVIGNMKCPYQIGDILWVRETFHTIHDAETHDFLRYGYKADNDYRGALWKPSLFMPKDACRIFLKIKSIRIEQLQDVSWEDAIAEGIKKTWISDNPECCKYKNYLQNNEGSLFPKGSFMSLWASINSLESWNSNPFVWVYEFEKIEKPLNFGG